MGGKTGQSEEFERLTQEISDGSYIISLSGLTSTAAKAYVLSRLQAETGKHFAVVTDSNSDAETLEGDLEFFSNIEQKNPGATAPGSDKSAIRNPQLFRFPLLKPTFIPASRPTRKRLNAGR